MPRIVLPRIILFMACLCLLPSLTGCGTVYKAAVDQRDVGTFVDDGRIESSVRALYVNDDLVKLRDISVNSYLGTVYVVGEFENDRQKMRAVKLARQVDGVRKVTIIPFVKRDDPACGTADELALYAKIKSRLVEDTTIWSTQVDVKTVQCNAVVLGLVASQRDADAIIRHINAVGDVRTVQNYVRIVK
ncbi:MAG TPA: BON domain-containing protein [Humidesulfovibrio sp.]|uniref:BON domain-containing protein n=1 Tax=Humidesulfovibrio sp. TaxID=2910988 RepID=UPI002B58A652|nr:BON domain-containing protein [Humidesulfovibrio sp.]HWR04627.1 BON domain-containing protein [Humidesulfovibrio sp.]